jgi:hypothetical protein
MHHIHIRAGLRLSSMPTDAAEVGGWDVLLLSFHENHIGAGRSAEADVRTVTSFPRLFSRR